MKTGALRTRVYWRVQLELCLQAERGICTSPPIHKAPDQACSDCPWLAGGGQFKGREDYLCFQKKEAGGTSRKAVFPQGLHTHSRLHCLGVGDGHQKNLCPLCLVQV